LNKMQAKYSVSVKVTDLRGEPVAGSQNLQLDRLQESQLLFGERVSVLDVKGGWAFIEALEQEKRYPDGSWAGYRGWVQMKDLMPVERFPDQNFVVTDHDGEYSFGTRLVGAKKPAPNMIDLGRKMIGFPYFWGGRSSYRPNTRSSVDCSGFVNLLYRVQGVDIPRDAHDQYLKSERINGADLEVGDLVFSGKNERITHVMLYSGEGRILEATEESGSVREIAGEAKFGVPLSKIRSGERVKGKNLFFGKYPTKVVKLRAYF